MCAAFFFHLPHTHMLNTYTDTRHTPHTRFPGFAFAFVFVQQTPFGLLNDEEEDQTLFSHFAKNKIRQLRRSHTHECIASNSAAFGGLAVVDVLILPPSLCAHSSALVVFAGRR